LIVPNGETTVNARRGPELVGKALQVHEIGCNIHKSLAAKQDQMKRDVATEPRQRRRAEERYDEKKEHGTQIWHRSCRIDAGLSGTVQEDDLPETCIKITRIYQ
jgi:hypothetical protein